MTDEYELQRSNSDDHDECLYGVSEEAENVNLPSERLLLDRIAALEINIEQKDFEIDRLLSVRDQCHKDIEQLDSQCDASIESLGAIERDLDGFILKLKSVEFKLVDKLIDQGLHDRVKPVVNPHQSTSAIIRATDIINSIDSLLDSVSETLDNNGDHISRLERDLAASNDRFTDLKAEREVVKEAFSQHLEDYKLALKAKGDEVESLAQKSNGNIALLEECQLLLEQERHRADKHLDLHHQERANTERLLKEIHNTSSAFQDVTNENAKIIEQLTKANNKYRVVTRKNAELSEELESSISIWRGNELGWLEPALALLKFSGRQWFESDKKYYKRLASTATALAKEKFQSDNISGLYLSSVAQALDPKPYRVKWYGFLLAKLGFSKQASEVLRGISSEVNFNSSEQHALRQLLPGYFNDPGSEIGHGAVLSNTAERIVPSLGFRGLLRELKLATIVDDFTFASYSRECNVLQLTPAGWSSECSEFSPDALFVESAWRGKDGLWGSKVGHNSIELQEIIAWCRSNGVPTVFWNKEDPVHFSSFLTPASQFDYIFTTDIDCVGKYKAVLKHDRVYLLPFACQPFIHNPIEIYQRKIGYSFAGAYYARYPERAVDLADFVRYLPKHKPLEIYDRNFGKDEPDYQFPNEYHRYIVGTLPFDEIDKAYKGYEYAINMNSIKNSQSMFARRVFELLASNTVVISNFSRGIKTFFGDLVVCSDSGEANVSVVRTLEEQESKLKRFKLAGLRKVLSEHTYERRLNYVISKLKSDWVEVSSSNVLILAQADTYEDYELLMQSFSRQLYSELTMLIVINDALEVHSPKDVRIRHIFKAEAQDLLIESIGDNALYIASFSTKDYYGANYITDIMLALNYSDADAIGKFCFYSFDSPSIRLINIGGSYQTDVCLDVRSAVFGIEKVKNRSLLNWVDNIDKGFEDSERSLSVDEFNYCRYGEEYARNESRKAVQEVVDDIEEIDLGESIADLMERAERIEPAAINEICDEDSMINGVDLARSLSLPKKSQVNFDLSNDTCRVISSLGNDAHVYFYQKNELPVESKLVEGRLPIHFEIEPGLNMRWVVLFLDENKERVSHVILGANQNHNVIVPEGVSWIRLGLRVYGAGEAVIRRLIFGAVDPEPFDIISRARHLVLTNHYPSYDDLYRNGFVHTRVSAYKRQGVSADVFRLDKSPSTTFHEFEGINCITGPKQQLDRLLAGEQYKSVLVHFLDKDMWEVLSRYIDKLKVTVWLHGAEIQPFHRREYNYTKDNERLAAMQQSEARMKFWRSLLSKPPKNLKLVFVSQYFANEVMEDLGFELSPDVYEIVHNPINTELFSYQEKSSSDRFKILSIRPFASNKYANDLSVNAILSLVNEPWFPRLQITIIGDGQLFDSTLEPLRGFDNITIERRFVKHEEMAELHRAHGIFLCPTRMDAQGVSRDEAMSSGLVPITNAVTAIPEFVDDDCGILAPGEDYLAMAAGIRMLIENPEKYLSMSQAASQRVRRQSSYGTTIDKEVFMIRDLEG